MPVKRQGRATARKSKARLKANMKKKAGKKKKK